MSRKGWLKLHRKTLDSDIFTKMDSDHLKVWIWLLCSAVTEETEIDLGNRYITLEPGDVAFTYREAALAVFGDEDKFNRISYIILNLISNEMLNKEFNKPKTVVHIVNWENYQFTQGKSQQTFQQEFKQEIQQKSQRKVNSLHILKEDKEEVQEFSLTDEEWDALEEVEL